mgnify:CR=1 FL=1
MKKLMLLGGSQYLLPVIKTAQDLGVYVVTCDYLPNNIAHILAYTPFSFSFSYISYLVLLYISVISTGKYA